MIEIFTDGSSRGNPGPGGYAAILRSEGHYKELSKGFVLTTNNRMELMAVIAALEALRKQQSVTVYSDSKYVIDAVQKGWVYKWKKVNFHNKKNADLWDKLLTLLDRHEVRLSWVKGHDGHPENERCDQLAVEAATNSELAEDSGYTY